MFYGQCWKCGELWELGTASTCKCPEELPAYTFKPPSEPVFAFFDTKPNHNFTFQNQDSKQVGALDYNGPEMVFTGDADESAKVFFDYVARSFKARLDQERADERNSWPAEMEAMERQVNILTDALNDRQRWFDAMTAQHKQEILAEREACAHLAQKTVCDVHIPTGTKIYGTAAAKAIRARGSNT